EDVIKLLNTPTYLLNANKIFFVGSRMSGNIAFALSCYFNNSIVLLFNPFTFDNSNNNIAFKDMIVNQPKYRIIDLKIKNIKTPNNAPKYIITNLSECNIDNAPSMGNIHAGYLIGEQNVKIILIPSQNSDIILTFCSPIRYPACIF